MSTLSLPPEPKIQEAWYGNVDAGRYRPCHRRGNGGRHERVVCNIPEGDRTAEDGL